MGSPRRVYDQPGGKGSIEEKARELMMEIGRRAAGEIFGSELHRQYRRATVELGSLVVMLTGRRIEPAFSKLPAMPKSNPDLRRSIDHLAALSILLPICSFPDCKS
jgi:hypothetical protein